jgi:uncharacterized protein (TIGR00369 family)
LRKLPNFQGCFVCGDRNPSGLAVRFWTDGEIVRTTFTPQEPQMGYRGITHGGVLASLLDETMGWAPCVINGRFCVSVELNVRYLRPLPVGTEVRITGRLVRSRSRIWETEGEVSGADGTVYAKRRDAMFPCATSVPAKLSNT